MSEFDPAEQARAQAEAEAQEQAGAELHVQRLAGVEHGLDRSQPG